MSFIRQKKSTNQLALDPIITHSHEVNRELSIILNSLLTYFGISYVSTNIHVLYICTKYPSLRYKFKEWCICKKKSISVFGYYSNEEAEKKLQDIRVDSLEMIFKTLQEKCL